MNLNIVVAGVCAVSLALFACSPVQAAEVFAEPVASKGRAGSGYSLSVFPRAGEEGVAFTMQLPAGLKNVDVSKCGRSKSDGAAVCRYVPETGKLAVVLFRLDGNALEQQEYELGQVMFAGGQSLAKLAPMQVTEVTVSSRNRDTASGVRQDSFNQSER
jgi:hypothetical protein